MILYYTSVILLFVVSMSLAVGSVFEMMNSGSYDLSFIVAFLIVTGLWKRWIWTGYLALIIGSIMLLGWVFIIFIGRPDAVAIGPFIFSAPSWFIIISFMLLMTLLMAVPLIFSGFTVVYKRNNLTRR